MASDENLNDGDAWYDEEDDDDMDFEPEGDESEESNVFEAAGDAEDENEGQYSTSSYPVSLPAKRLLTEVLRR